MSDVVGATAAGAPAVSADAPDNIAAEMRHGDAAAAEAAFARAAVRVALDLVNQRVAPVAMEPRSVVASFDRASGTLTVRISNQMPTAVAAGIAGALPDLAQDKVRVLVGDVGGGFGMKTGAYPEDIVVAHAARALGRPVHWQAERSEEFLSASHGRDVTSRAELALDANGKALALRVRSRANVGAYATPAGIAIQLMIGPWVSTSIYDIRTVDLHLQAVLTNTMSTGPYRGAGRPEAIYIIERLFDAAAREMKIDPAELRRRNMIRPEQMPYKNALGQTYDTGAFEKILDQGLALADWNGFAGAARRLAPARQAARARHRDLSRMDRRQRVRGEGQRRRHARRLHRDLLGDAGDGAGHRDELRAARGRRVRRADREDPHRPGRHRARQRLRQRRIALALHRRLGGARRVRAHGRARQGARRRGARGGGGRHRVPRRALVGRRHRRRHRSVRARRQAARSAHPPRRDDDGRRRDVAERMPRLRGRGRCRHGRRSRRRLRVGQRHRPCRQPDDRARPGRRRRACKGSARRSASRSSTTATASQLVTGSFMDYAVPRADLAVRVQDRVRHLDPDRAQPARREGRRRARHDRRDAGGDQRRHRRARPRRARPRRREDPDARDTPSASGRCCARRPPAVKSVSPDRGRTTGMRRAGAAPVAGAG